MFRISIKSISRLIGALFIFLLAGCGGATRPPEMVAQNFPRTFSPHGPVVVTTGGGQQTSFFANAQISNADFAAALTESLRRSGLFENVALTGPSTFRLQATIVDLTQPLNSINTTIYLTCDWSLVRVSERQVIWHETIKSTYTVAFGDEMMALNRQRIATEGAARQNIEIGLSKLAAVNF